ncbi:MAG TPA: hypothetical protein VGB74_07115 [Actinoplanes sp.]
MIRAHHLMDPWRDALIAELRMRDVSGIRIGEALAEVDAFCADSGQTPAEAFGDPVEYAKSLIDVHNSDPTTPTRVRQVVRGTGLAFATLAGVFSLLNGVEGLVVGGPAEVTAGQLTSVALGTALFPFVAMAIFDPRLRQHQLVLPGVVVVSFLAPALPTILWGAPVAHLSAWLLLIAGLFLLAVAWWPTASDRIFADRIIDPRTGTEPFATPRLLIAAVRWTFPAMLLFAVVLLLLFR